MALDALIFDVDGTLVDSNGAHIKAWRRAFERLGYKVPADRIFDEIGKGGDQLVPHVIGRDADKKDGDALRKAQPEEFEKIIRADGLKPFPGAADLIRKARQLGLKTAIATSSQQKQFKLLEEISGVEWHSLVDELVDASQVEKSKPAPDVVSKAVEKLKLSPAQCAMLGDTPYDAESCLHAGVACIGLNSGGHESETLMVAGCRTVRRDTAEVLADLDEVLKAVSPGSAHLDQQMLATLMRAALVAAEQGLHAGEVPIGAVLARGDGSILASGFNQQLRQQNPAAHAEIVTFAAAAGHTVLESRDLILVSTLEPCVMCTGAAMVSGVDTVVYGLKAPADSGTGRISPPRSPESQMPRIAGSILAKESRALFEEWLGRDGNSTKQVEFVRQLLGATK